MKNFQFQIGQSLIEILIVIGLTAIILPALLTGLVSSREGKLQQNQRLQATALLNETIEAVRSVREKGWASFAVNGIFHPQISGSEWTLIAGSQTLNGFTRQVVISDVYRNLIAGPIVDSGIPGAVLDPSTKKVVTTISWNLPSASSIEETLYLTRYLETEIYTETTETQFNAGTKTSVGVRGTSPPLVADDGEVILGSGGYSNWCTPTLLTPGTDLSGQGVAKGIMAVEGKAYAGTGENSSGYSFIGINITNSHPPSAVQESTFDGHKTNSVFGDLSYGYIATDTNSKEVVIIRLSPLPYTEIGYFDAPGGSSGRSVYVAGNIGYVTVGDKLYNFDLSSKTGSRPGLDTNGVQLAGNGSQVVVNGGYAYVSIEGNSSTEMQVISVSTPNNLTVVGQANVDSASARDLYINPSATHAYLATQEDSGRRELFIIDIFIKTGNRPTLGTYDANGMDPKGVTVVLGNRVILVGWNAEEYQVVDISNETAPVRCGGLQVNSGINGIASVQEADGDAYSYIVTQDINAEFRIIEGGPGGAYATNGTFESQTFNPGNVTANNRFMATFSEPAGTEIKFQVALANLVGGLCPTTGNFTFVGPSGTEIDYFEQASGESITFPFTTYLNYSNPGQCFRYKAFLSTANASTPVLNDTTINYSP